MGLNDRLGDYAKWIAPWLGLGFSVFHLWTLNLHILPQNIFRPIHVLFSVILILLLNPTVAGRLKKEWRIIDLLLIVVAVVTFFYAIFQIDYIMDRGGLTNTSADLIFGTIAILLILETARRSIGPALPLISLFFLCYAMLGQYIPGSFGHRGYSYSRMISTVFSYDGIFGIALAVVSTFVTMFIIFGAMLQATGVGEYFLDLSKSIAGKQRGGPAKIACVASAFFGSISGSAVANTVSTGAITIPLMKKTGYKPAFAAAVEAAASTGGQIMPPVMAAGAFIMAEMLGTSYVTIMKAAIIPALIYFVNIWIAIDLRSARTGLKGLSEDKIPALFPLLRHKGGLLLSLVVLIYFLVIIRVSPIFAAFWSLVTAIILFFLIRTSQGIPQKFRSIIEGLKTAPFTCVQISVASACAGIVIGIVGMTGLGLQIARAIVDLSMGYKIITLFLAMCTGIVFGMGLPTSVAYILIASILAPALMNVGIIPIAAHMFLFYFATAAAITPPIAMAAYAGAAIAGANFTEVGFLAMRLAIPAFIVPYIFVYSNELLMIGIIPHIILAVVTALIGCAGLASGLEGWLITNMSLFERGLIIVGALFLLSYGIKFDIIGIALIGIVIIKKIRLGK